MRTAPRQRHFSPAGGIWAAKGNARWTVGLVLAVTFSSRSRRSCRRHHLAGGRPPTGRPPSLRVGCSALSLLASLIGIVLAGTLADRVPLGQPMLAGLVLFALGLIIGGTAPDMLVLVAGRAVQGLGAGVVPAVAYVAISRCYAEESRPRMFAVLSTAWVVPGLIGPAIAALVAAAVGWRWVFLGLLPLVIAAGVLVVLALRHVPPPASPGTAPVPYLAVLGVVAVDAAKDGAGGAQFRGRARGRGGRCGRRRASRSLHAPADTTAVPDRTAGADRHHPQPAAAGRAASSPLATPMSRMPS